VCRETTDDIEVAAAQEGGIVHDGIGRDALGFLAFEENFIEFTDRVPNRLGCEGFGEDRGDDDQERKEEFHRKRKLVKKSDDFSVGKEGGIFGGAGEQFAGNGVFEFALPIIDVSRRGLDDGSRGDGLRRK
jgi:hypothetical protein